MLINKPSPLLHDFLVYVLSSSNLTQTLIRVSSAAEAFKRSGHAPFRGGIEERDFFSFLYSFRVRFDGNQETTGMSIQIDMIRSRCCDFDYGRRNARMIHEHQIGVDEEMMSCGNLDS